MLGTVLIMSLSVAGCGSTCGANCPPTLVDVLAPSGENLNVLSAHWTGPACPVGAQPLCRGDISGANNCVLFSILGSQTGTCELDLVFNDGRAPFSVVAEFGAETHQGCCHGFPVIGPTTVMVPPLHPIVLPDAGADATDDDAGNGSDSAVDVPPDVAPDWHPPADLRRLPVGRAAW